MKRVSLWRLGFIGAVTLVCLYLVGPTLHYYLALGSGAEKARLDELSKAAIPLGLDLRGGVDVTLKIDEQKAHQSAVALQIRTLKNQMTTEKLSAEVNASENGETIIVRLLDKEQARQLANLLSNEQALVSSATEDSLKQNGVVEVELKREMLTRSQEADIEGALTMVRERLDKFGQTQPSIARQGKNRIRIQMPGEENPDKLIENLTMMAQMEFRLAHEMTGTGGDPTGQLLDEKGELKPDAVVPLGYRLVPYKFGHTDPDTHAIKYTEGKMLVEDNVLFNGKNLRGTGVQQDPTDINNPIKVSLQFDDAASEIFANATRESVNKLKADGQPRQLAVLLDGVVRTAPALRVVITGGSAVIEGGFNFEEAKNLSQVLKAGSLPAPLAVESKSAVGPSVGEQSIFGGVRALVWGSAAVIAFMIAYYGMAGVISVIALILNVLITLAVLALGGSTLTLSGIAGLLLTIGMAVDTNVLIYERIREEVDGGRPLKQAISHGFTRAFSVIIDSHVTTLLTAMVLLQFTEGSVFGFALTMTFGLLANLYTGLTVTHTLCALWFQWRGSLNLGKIRIFKTAAYNFIGAAKATIGGSWVVILVGIALVLFQGGLRFGVDFAGGIVAQVHFEQATSENELRKVTADLGFKGERVQNLKGTGDHDFYIRVPATGANAAGELESTDAKLRSGLTKEFGEGKFQILQVDSVGPETGQEFRNMAIIVIMLASLAIGAYLWFRFELIFGIAAVIALIHDLFLTVAWSQVWGVEITLDVVASLMILLGFSVNDTIVIFDRIRENTRKMPSATFGEICNSAMNECLSRTIITSGTVFLVVVMMLTFGGEGFSQFAKVLFIGVLVGTYSSCFIAAPIVYFYNKREKDKVAKALSAKKSIGPEPARDPNRERELRSAPRAGRIQTPRGKI